MACDGIDHWALRTVVPLAIYMIASGLDDLFVTLTVAVQWLRRRTHSITPDLHSKPEKLIAIVLPLWQESRVIAGMVQHNLAAVDYSNYHIFAGAYPNDRPTMNALAGLEARFENVHVALCPHPGPTSKADCLNWIYQRLLLFEEQHNVRFEILITHDAEDLIHPLSLRAINHYADDYDMVQVPVLPLPTPLRELTHGVYCDEFAEFQIKDMRARQALGSFIPSNGVGTGYRRCALERLAETRSNRIFEPACLTEDYENGLALAELGCRQLFLPVTFRNGAPIATREYFPRTFRAAVRQRTRWITGNALQAWERHGWHGGLRIVYWLWRDRKGLLGNPLSILTNALFLYGVLTWLWSLSGTRPWGLGALAVGPWVLITATLQAIALSVRAFCVGRIFGWRFAAGVPVRAVVANLINSIAGCKAIVRYVWARLHHQPLVWVKTEHAYPSRETLLQHKRPLEDVLVGEGFITPQDVEEAQTHAPDWADWLVAEGRLDEDDLYETISLQEAIPLFRPQQQEVTTRVARSLPAHVLEECKVLPLEIRDGEMWLGAPCILAAEIAPKLRRFTRLDVRFALLTRTDFETLREQLL
jgi:adsorption protein B